MSNIHQKWVKLLVPFTTDAAAKLTASDLARASGVPQQTTARILDGLARENLLRYERHGRNRLYTLDQEREETSLLLSIVEHHKALAFLARNDDASLLVRDLLSTCGTVILFGSYASGLADGHSDLDVLLLGNVAESRLEEIKKRSPIPVNEHHATPETFARLLREQQALAHEIRKNHICFGDISLAVRLFQDRMVP